VRARSEHWAWRGVWFHVVVFAVSRKTWYLKKSTVSHPLRGCTPHYKGTGNVEEQLKVHRMQNPAFQFSAEEDGEDVTKVRPLCMCVQLCVWVCVCLCVSVCTCVVWLRCTGVGLMRPAVQITLGPGDVLYHPAGVWHRVDATEDSLSINLSIVATTWADIAADAVRQLLWRDNRYRATFTSAAPSTARVRLGPMLASLRQALGRLRPEHLLPDAHFLPPSSVLCCSHPDVPRSTQAIHAATVLSANPLAAVLRFSDIPSTEEDEGGDEAAAGAGDSADDGAGDGKREHEQEHEHDGEGDCDSHVDDGSDCEGDSGDDGGSSGHGRDTAVALGGDEGSPSPAPPGHAGYIVHLNYGNDGLQSHMRTELHVPEESVPVMEWLLAHAWSRPEGFTVASVCHACGDDIQRRRASSIVSAASGSLSVGSSATRTSEARGAVDAAIVRLFQVLLYCGVVSLGNAGVVVPP